MNDDKIQWTLTPDDVEWNMPWKSEGYDPSGKKEDEVLFDKEGALCHLLMNEVCFLNDFWYEKNWPADAQKCINIFVSCGDTFAYACADAVRLHFEDIEDLYRMWRKDPGYGPTAWCVKTRKEMPIQPVVRALRERGYDIDSWGLRDNTTNDEVQAAFAYAAAKSRQENSG